MPNPNPTIHNYLNESIEFNKTSPDLSITTLPHGTDNTVEYAHVPTFPTALNSISEYAIHAWIKADATCSIHSRIIQTPKKGTEGVTNAFMFGLLGDDAFYGTVNNALRLGMSIDREGSSTRVTCDPVIKPDTWHHVVGQVNSGVFLEIYVDGCIRELVAHAPLDYTLDTSNTIDPTGLVVGWDPNLAGPFKGNISSLAIFNRRLTAEEIATLAQGTTNLIGVSQNLKSSLFAWWKMGDKDPTGLVTLNDSVGTNHLTTRNMDENNRKEDVPPEAPRKHHCLHLSTGADVLPLDPNGVGCPFLWDSFRVIDAPTVIPHGWFGNIDDVHDTFTRRNIPGRLSVLRFNKGGDGTGDEVMFITNVASGATGNTLVFGNPGNPDPTEYCMEILASSRQPNAEAAGGIHYFGFINDPHGYTDPSTRPQVGVYLSWESLSGILRIHSTNSGAVGSSVTTLIDDQFYRIKLCFKYYNDETGTLNIFVSAEVDGNGHFSASFASTADLPSGSGDIFIGTSVSGNDTYSFDVVWVSVTHRGIGADGILTV